MAYFTQDYNKDYNKDYNQDEKIIQPNNAQNCTSCGKVFLKFNNNEKYCENCKKQAGINDDFYILKDYIKKNKDLDVLNISKATGVSISIIMKHMINEN